MLLTLIWATVLMVHFLFADEKRLRTACNDNDLITGIVIMLSEGLAYSRHFICPSV